MEKVRKKELAKHWSENFPISREEASRMISEVFEVIVQKLEQGYTVEIPKYFIFEPYERKARVTVNPQTREKMEVEAMTSVKVKPLKKVKERLNQ